MIDFIDLRIHNTYTVRRESRIKVVCCVLSLEAIGADPLLIFSAYMKIHHSILEPLTAIDTGTRHHAEGVRLVRTVVVRLECGRRIRVRFRLTRRLSAIATVFTATLVPFTEATKRCIAGTVRPIPARGLCTTWRWTATVDTVVDTVPVTGVTEVGQKRCTDAVATALGA